MIQHAPLHLCKFVVAIATIFWLALSAAITASHAQERETVPVLLEHQDFFTDLTAHTEFLIDNSRQLSVDEALSAQYQDKFQAVETAIIDFGFLRSRFFLKFRVRNNTDDAGVWKLSPEVPIMEEMHVYVLRDNASSPERILLATNRDPFSARPEASRNYVTDLSLAGNEQATVVVQYQSAKATQMPLFIESADHYYSRVKSEDIHNWAVLGVLFGIATISTIYMAALGLRAGLFYFAYLACVSVYLFNNDGYGIQYLWPNAPYWNSIASAPFGVLGVMFLALFARSYVSTINRHKWPNRLLLAYAFVGPFMAAASLLFVDTLWLKIVALSYTGIGGFVPLIGAVFAIRDKQPGSFRFMIGSLFVGLSFALVTFGYFSPGLVNQDIFGHFTRYAMVIEGYTFAGAIFAHTQTVRRERAIALKAQIALSDEKLALSEALRSAETEHMTAMNLAESRREVMAAAAHDIRQPLTSLRIALLQLNKKDAKNAAQITSSFDYLDGIVNANLEDTRPASNGEIRLVGSPDAAHKQHGLDANEQQEVFDISIVLQNIMEMFRHEAHQKGIELSVNDVDAKVISRPIDLMRIISNLVSNAIKNTQEGSVTINCFAEKTSLRIDIADSGNGFDPKKLEQLQKAYARSGDYMGEGLGLSVVSTLADKNGIQTNVKSQLGVGSTFSLHIPRP